MFRRWRQHPHAAMRSPIVLISAIVFTIASSILLAIAFPQSSHGFGQGGPSLSTIEGNPVCPGPPSTFGVFTFNAGQFCDSQTLGTTLSGFKFVLSGNDLATSVAAATTDFMTVSGSAAPSGTENNVRTQWNSTCTVTNLNVFQATAANTNVPVYTFRVNGASTALTCSIANTAFTCADGVDNPALGNNQNYDLMIVNPASAAATGAISWSVTVRC